MTDDQSMECVLFETGEVVNRPIAGREHYGPGDYKDIPLLRASERLEWIVGESRPLILTDGAST